MRQNATIEPPVRELTAQQDTVLAALLTGKNVTAAAGEAGIARQTVHRWLASDADFIAAHNRGRREIAGDFSHFYHLAYAREQLCKRRAHDAHDHGLHTAGM